MNPPEIPYVYHTVFSKRDGSDRSIKYIVSEDLAEDFKKQEIKGVRTRNLPAHSSLVWDIEANAFRTLNRSTIKQVPTPCGRGILRQDSNGEWTYIFESLNSPPACTN